MPYPDPSLQLKEWWDEDTEFVMYLLEDCALIDCDILCVESIRKCDTNFLLNWQGRVKRGGAGQILCRPNRFVFYQKYFL